MNDIFLKPYILYQYKIWFNFFFKTKTPEDRMIYLGENMATALFGALQLFLLTIVTYLFGGVILLSYFSGETIQLSLMLSFMVLSFTFTIKVVYVLKNNSDYSSWRWAQIKRKQEENERKAREEREKRQKEREEFFQRQEEERRKYYKNRYSKTQHTKRISIQQLLQTLELSTDIKDFSVIKKQYRKLMKKYHPDVYKGNDNKAREIIEAYEKLKEILT